MKHIFVVTDANYGAVAFTTLNKALEYIFGDNDTLINECMYSEKTEHNKEVARQEIIDGKQYSGELPHLGSFTLTEAPLLNRNNDLNIWREIDG